LELPEQLLVRQRKRVASIRGDVENRPCLSGTADQDRGRDENECRAFEFAPEWNPRVAAK
jgi:hypothetical protein